MTTAVKAGLGAALVLAVLGGVSGCPLGRQAQDEQRVREIVRDELRTGRTQAVLEQLTKEAGVGPLVTEAIESPEIQSRLARTLESLLASPDIQDRLSSQVKELLGSPELQAALQDAVRQQLMQIIQGGGGGGAGQ